MVVVVPIAAGESWGVLDDPRSAASGAPSRPPASGREGAPDAQLIQACIRQTKGQEAYEHFQRAIPADRWGDPVRGTVSTFSEPYVLWLFDADCRSYEALAVPPRTSRTFRAYVGQVWYFAEASAKQPVGSCDCNVFRPSNSGIEQPFGDTGRLVYRTG
ncbi:hypothetical protein ACGFJ5_13025 [Micromonospora echinaurantiaca]|uniref:hypothetical protein n=1 Tax=Micromonospora echinaurantiaca TaxID=47857 RepID=UPI003720F39A